jgi:hypothetical protein
MTERAFVAPTGRSIQLRTSGLQARVIPDDIDDGWLLDVGGIIQSHVDLTDPLNIRYEYLRRMANVIDLCWPPATPLAVLHLGAGALTLPRYVQASRPGSQQTVIELERELTTMITTELPLPEGTQLTSIIGDAREEANALSAQRFDVIVLDIYTGFDTAEHLTGQDFYAELLNLLNDGGALLINIGDEIGLRFFARQAQELETAADAAGLSGAWALADVSMLDRLHYGNVVLAAGGALTTGESEALRARLLGAGPHPAAVLEPAQTADLAARIMRG